jgi:hypothetical protein
MTALSLYRYILIAAMRDRLLISVLVILGVVASLSMFFGASALTEQIPFVVTSASSGFRLFGIACLVLFTINYIRRSFDGRDIDYLLSRPVSRVGFVLIHAAAFSTLALLIAFIYGGATALLQWRFFHFGVAIWWVSLGIELIIMANVAMFFAFFLRSATACTVIVFGFYLLTRLIGEILGILSVPRSSKFITLLENVMEFVSIFLPRLDLMAQTKWMLYSVQPDVSIGFLLMQGAVFLFLIISATAVDMQRRQF